MVRIRVRDDRFQGDIQRTLVSNSPTGRVIGSRHQRERGQRVLVATLSYLKTVRLKLCRLIFIDRKPYLWLT